MLAHDGGLYDLGRWQPRVRLPRPPYSHSPNDSTKWWSIKIDLAHEFEAWVTDRIQGQRKNWPQVQSIPSTDVDVHDPASHFSTGWHRDGGNQPDLPVWLVAWGTRVATEVALPWKQRTPLPTLPGHVYVLDNRTYVHRCPESVQSIHNGRWFCRTYYSSVTAVRAWRELTPGRGRQAA